MISVVVRHEGKGHAQDKMFCSYLFGEAKVALESVICKISHSFNSSHQLPFIRSSNHTEARTSIEFFQCFIAMRDGRSIDDCRDKPPRPQLGKAK